VGSTDIAQATWKVAMSGKFRELESGYPEHLAVHSIRVTSGVTWILAVRSLSI